MRNIIIPENFSVEEASEYRKKLNELIESGEKDLTLDFSKCTFIDSTGLGVLVSLYKRCSELNGSFVLQSITNPQVLKIFKLTRLDKVFKIAK